MLRLGPAAEKGPAQVAQLCFPPSLAPDSASFEDFAPRNRGCRIPYRVKDRRFQGQDIRRREHTLGGSARTIDRTTSCGRYNSWGRVTPRAASTQAALDRPDGTRFAEVLNNKHSRLFSADGKFVGLGGPER